MYLRKARVRRKDPKKRQGLATPFSLRRKQTNKTLPERAPAHSDPLFCSTKGWAALEGGGGADIERMQWTNQVATPSVQKLSPTEYRKP